MATAIPQTGQSEEDSTGPLLVISVSIDAINEIMITNDSLSGLGQSGETYLVGSDYLMRSTSRFLPASILRTRVETPAARYALAGNPGTSIVHDYRGIPVLSSYGMIQVPGLQWVLLAEIDEQEAMIPVRSILTKILIISTIIIIVYFTLVFIIARQITKPLIRLRNAATNLGEGRFDIEVPVYTHDEIGALTESFNIMARQIREKTTELQQERFGRMRSVIDGEEMERQRLSRELHDGIGQLLIPGWSGNQEIDHRTEELL
jgi:HAMP domain-containing protein